MTDGLRIACIGAGFFARFHREAWAALNRARLSGVADPDLAAAQATGLPAYASAEALLEALGPDVSDVVLDIAAPPPAHAALIRLGASAGVRAVICQKPFCGDLAVAEAVAVEAETAGLPLLVHENFRFQPWYRAMRAVLDAGTVGPLRNLTFRLRPGDGQGPRAYLDRQPYFQTMPRFLVHETAIHWIDTFRYLAGEPEAVFADLRRLNPAIAGEDAGHVLFRLPGGARALFDGNRLLDHDAEDRRRTMGEALIEGDAGTLTLIGDGSVALRRFGARGVEPISPPPPPDAGFGGGCVKAFQAHALSVLLDEAEPETSAAQYLRNLRAEAAVYASAEAGAWVDLAA